MSVVLAYLLIVAGKSRFAPLVPCLIFWNVFLNVFRDSRSLVILIRFANKYHERMHEMILVRVLALVPKRNTGIISVTQLELVSILTLKMASWFNEIVMHI